MWPDDRDLPVEVDAAWGANVLADPGTWSWTSLSDRLRREPISIKVGKSPGASVVSPSTASILLDNADGALTPLHGMSPWWPHVDVGVPMRLRLRWAEDTFARTSTGGWGTSPSGQVWSHFGGLAPDFPVSSGIAAHRHSTVNHLRRTTLTSTLLDCEQVVDVATPVALTGAALVTGVMARVSADQQTYYWLRCEFNASGGNTVQLKLSRSVAGVLTEIASLDPVPGLTYTPGVPLRVRADVDGTRLAIKAWPAADPEPSGWQLTATDTTITTPGRIGLQSWLVGGNTNTLPVDVNHSNYAARVTRLFGSADQWEPTYLPTTDPNVTESAVRIAVAGVLRRIQLGTPPKRSAMRRSIAGAPGVRAYWPCEDGVTSQQAASAIPGHPPALVTGGTPAFVQVGDVVLPNWTVRYGTSALVDLSSGVQVIADIPADVTAAVASWYTVSCVATGAELPLTATTNVLMAWDTPGGTPYVRYEVQQVTDTSTFYERVVGVTASGTRTVLISSLGYVDNLDTFGVICRQVGINITLDLRRVGGSLGTATFAGTLAGPSRATLNPSGTTSVIPLPYGHLAVWAGAGTAGGLGPVIDSYGVQVLPDVYAYPAEAAHLRLARLTAEDGIAMSLPAVAAGDVIRMGWQPIEAALPLYQQCSDADGGILYERGQGLGYLPRVARYNQAPALIIDLATYRYSGGQADAVLAPVRDDQDVTNEWTVTRTEGSSAVVADRDHQHRTGVRPASVELNLADDSRLADHAGLRVHLGTAVTLRDPSIPLDLAANPELVEAWLACQVGSRIQRTNPPAQYPGVADRIIDGWTETLGPRLWMVQLATSPAGPWDVAVAGGAQRASAIGSTLAAPLSAGAMTMSIVSPAANGRWTTSPASMPLDIRVGGEHVTASAISGTGLTQTVTISQRGVNGVQRAWLVGTPVDVMFPAIAAL